MEFDLVLRNVYVRPFYLSLLHGAFTGHRESGTLAERISEAARTISDRQIETLLAEQDWRSRLCAAWFAGLTKRQRFVPPIADLLIASAQVYAGQGYCLALALIGNTECAQHLRSYLARYLPLNGRIYDQDWALGALAHIEGHLPSEFLDPILWSDGDQSIDPMEGVRLFKAIFSCLQQHHMISA